jgi:hypothetical protein
MHVGYIRPRNTFCSHLSILNSPHQDNGNEHPSHLKAKVLVAKALSAVGYDVKYEVPFTIPGYEYPYKVDVHLVDHNVYIEIDGKSHWSKIAKWRDAMRDEFLAETHHQRAIRIPIEEALEYPESVIPRVDLLAKVHV